MFAQVEIYSKQGGLKGRCLAESKDSRNCPEHRRKHQREHKRARTTLTVRSTFLILQQQPAIPSHTPITTCLHLCSEIKRSKDNETPSILKNLLEAEEQRVFPFQMENENAGVWSISMALGFQNCRKILSQSIFPNSQVAE